MIAKAKDVGVANGPTLRMRTVYNTLTIKGISEPIITNTDCLEKKPEFFMEKYVKK
jgi:hypothetical protein